jgi:hypothetical protein
MRNAILYKLWFKKCGKSKLKLPNRKDSFYFAGYPRSGNTYFTKLISAVLPELIFSHHLHTGGAKKLAFQSKLPVLIIIREPLESVASLYIMNNKGSSLNVELIDKYIEDYVEYHTFVFDNRSIIKIVEFEKLIKKPQLILDSLKNLDINLSIQQTDYDILASKVKNNMVQKSQLKMSKEHALRFSSTPNSHRNSLKEEVKKSIIANYNLNKASTLFKALIK